MRFFGRYRFLSKSLDKLFRTLVDNDQKIMKNLKEVFVDNDETFNTVNEIEEEERTFKDIKKDYPEEFAKLEEALLNYMGENDLKI